MSVIETCERCERASYRGYTKERRNPRIRREIDEFRAKGKALHALTITYT